MGQSKRLMEEEFERDMGALSFLLKVEAVEECEIHDGYYSEGGLHVDDAIEIAEEQIKSGELELDEPKEAFFERLRRGYNENTGLDGCARCENNANSD